MMCNSEVAMMSEEVSMRRIGGGNRRRIGGG
jgi:hypothetical protein